MTYTIYPGVSKPTIVNRPFETTIKYILDYYNLKLADVMNKTKKHEIVLARMFCMCALRYEHGWTLIRIANYFHKKDHTTVRHAIATIKDLTATDSMILEQAKIHCPNILVEIYWRKIK